jgi:ribose transport system ATP-binding protein
MNNDARGRDRHTVPPRLEVNGISKTFGQNCALADVSLNVRPGEIHGLVGQNGSGKSTLAKVLTGYHTPDSGGSVLVDGSALVLPVSPLEARRRGVGVVHQSLGLVDDLTVLENLRVGRFRAGRLSRRISWREESAAATQALARLGRDIPLHIKAGALPEEDRATVAIARALQDAPHGAGVIIFDESTRSLARETLERFYEMVGGIVASGTSVLLITHRLEEIIDATDRVTVLRDGVAVESGLPTSQLSEPELVRLVLGRTLVALEPGSDGRSRSSGPARADGGVVVVENATGDIAKEVVLNINRGEVLGVTGLEGAGHDELPYLLTGAHRARAGSLTIDGRRLDLAKLDAAAAIGAGIVLVPEGRDRAGLALELSMHENVALPLSLGRRRLLPVGRLAERQRVADWIDRLDIRPADARMVVSKLSGGNQQKVLLAKWLATRPRLLVLHEPTQAVDVGARQAIIAAIRKAAAEGCAVLVAGSDENELSLLCDRIAVFRDGRIEAELVDDLSADAIMEATFSRRPRLRHTGGSAMTEGDKDD